MVPYVLSDIRCRASDVAHQSSVVRSVVRHQLSNFTSISIPDAFQLFNLSEQAIAYKVAYHTLYSTWKRITALCRTPTAMPSLVASPSLPLQPFDKEPDEDEEEEEEEEDAFPDAAADPPFVPSAWLLSNPRYTSQHRTRIGTSEYPYPPYRPLEQQHNWSD